MAPTPITLHGQPDSARAVSRLRIRWAAIGAAIAVTLGAGGLSITHAVLETGDRSVFVPIAPCRLIDTRPAPDNVGTPAAQIGVNDRIVVNVRDGAVGGCPAIPVDASALAMNVTALNGTQDSYLAVFPSNLKDPPLASNLNWKAGAAPSPNKVDVRISAAGAIAFYNRFGHVDVFADVVGYYVDHTHDDRYYTKAQVRKLVSGEHTCNAVDFLPSTSDEAYSGDVVMRSAPVVTWLYCGAQIPVGASIDRLTASMIDDDAVNDYRCRLLRRPRKDTSTLSVVDTVSTTAAGGAPQVITGVPDPAATATAQTNYVIACTVGPGASILGATVEYTVSGPAL